jgi:hypothetical protein
MDEKQIILKIIKESNASDFVAICESKDCKQLINIDGQCYYYGWPCDFCDKNWCNNHMNEAVFYCEDCGWGICLKCSSSNKCSICGTMSNHKCDWSTKCICHLKN